MPNLIGGIILGYVWQLLLNGILEMFQRALTYASVYGFLGLLILMCWQQVGYLIIIYIARIQNITGELIEEAKTDRTNPKQIFRTVTILIVMPFNMSQMLALNIFETFYGRSV